MKKLLLLTLFTLSISGLFAQWIPQATGFAVGSRGINYVHAVTANIVWAIGYDGSGTGTYITEFTKTTNGGNLWVPGQVLTLTNYGLGNICAIDENTAWVAVYYNGNQNNNCGVYKTINGGASWVQQPVLQGASSFANNVYFWDGNKGMAHGDLRDGYFEAYTTTDGGDSWTRVPVTDFSGVPVLTGEGGWTSVIEVTGTSTVMFGTNKGNLYKSDDFGLTWVASYTGASAAGTNGGINQIAFKDPMNGLVAHANETTYMFDLYETSDGGATWGPVNYTGNCFSNDIKYVPGSYNTYVTTGAATANSGCSYSFDGGHTWTEFNGTTGVQFLAMDWIDNATGWAGDFNDATSPTTIGGMYKYNGVLTDILQINPLQGGFSIYPNPGNGLLTLAVIGAENMDVQIRIYDMIGKLVYQDIENQSLVSYNKTIDLQYLPKGMYVAQLSSGKNTYQQKIVIE